MPTSSSMEMVCFLTCSLVQVGLCRAMTSSTCAPMRNTGLSDVIGSWKIIDSLLPRIFSMAYMGIFATS